MKITESDKTLAEICQKRFLRLLKAKIIISLATISKPIDSITSIWFILAYINYIYNLIISKCSMSFCLISEIIHPTQTMFNDAKWS